MDAVAQAQTRVARARSELFEALSDLAGLVGDCGEQLPDAPREIAIIRDLVADFFQIPVSQLCGKCRPLYIADARQIAMVLSRELTGHSLDQIGRAFRRDHGTVIHAVRSVPNKCAADRQLEQNYQHMHDLAFLALQRLPANNPEREPALQP